MAKFRLSGLTNSHQVVDFDKQKVAVGRSKSNDFVVEDGAVSRQQAQITHETDGYILRNIGRFPVKVNYQPTEYCILQSGDVLSLGNNSQFRFEVIDTDEDLVTQIPETSVAIDLEEAMRLITGHKVNESKCSLANRNSNSNSNTDNNNNSYTTTEHPALDDETETNEFTATIAQINQRINRAGVFENIGETESTEVTDSTGMTESTRLCNKTGVSYTEISNETKIIDKTEGIKETECNTQQADNESAANGEETLIEPVPAILTVLNGPEPGKAHLLEKRRFVIGRAADCDIVIDDPRVSRNHVAIEKRASAYFLVRLTQHQTVLVNSQPVDECQLFNSDLIEFFTQSFTFKSTNPADQRATHPLDTLLPRQSSLDETGLSDATVLRPNLHVKKPGPRLVNHSKCGGSTVYRLSPGRTCVGRDAGCDIVIEGDKSVSRLHAVIEKQGKGYFVCAESMNPVLHNSKRVRQATRLYSGDTLQLGDTLLTFLSEFKEDQSPAKKWTSRVVLPVTSALSIALLGLLIYSQLWQPWAIEKQIVSAEQHISNAENNQGLRMLSALYTRQLDAKQRSKVAQLLSTSQLALASQDIEQGALESARDRLVNFLRQYGADTEMAESWQKLNEVRFLLAKRYQAEGSTKAAMKEYVAIDGDSDLYNSAQKAISDIWFESQAPVPVTAQTDALNIEDLLAEAELLFDKKHFLTPINSNAYTLYAQILTRDTANSVALNKIEAMKAFYQKEGNSLCLRGDQALAETYFRRFLIIEPENRVVQQSLANVANCAKPPDVVAGNQHATSSQSANSQAGDSANTRSAVALVSATSEETIAVAGSENKQKVKNLLKQEGIESTWIMEYLFDEPTDNGNQPAAETPW